MPLGIRAVVVAIYEPPQISSPLEVELMDDQEEEKAVDVVAKQLGLQKVNSTPCMSTRQTLVQVNSLP